MYPLIKGLNPRKASLEIERPTKRHTRVECLTSHLLNLTETCEQFQSLRKKKKKKNFSQIALVVKPSITPKPKPIVRGSEEKEGERIRDRNGVAVDDTGVRGGSGGRHSYFIDPAFTQGTQESSGLFGFAYSATGPLHRPLRRVPAPR